MSHVIYAYIAKPSRTQIAGFLHALSSRGVRISHIGKKDPPRKFTGNTEDAISIVLDGTNLTNSTFARDSASGLGITIDIHHDPRWTHSTVSASCPYFAVLDFVMGSASAAFDLFIGIRGDLGKGKKQSWEIVSPPSNSCPADLRSRFVAT